LKGLPTGVWLATLLGFYINFLTDAYLTFVPLYAIGVGISLSMVGILKSVHSAAATVIRFAAAGVFLLVPVGVVNHTSVLAMALGTIALSFITTEPLLAALFVLLGTCRGLLRVTSATMIAEQRTRPGASVGMASAVYNAGLDTGNMLGPPVAGILAGALGIPATFRVVALALPAVYYAVWFTQRLRQGRTPATDVARAI
jgi:MFS family permease